MPLNAQWDTVLPVVSVCVTQSCTLMT